MRARRYEASDALQWDNFVRDSKNGTFLFERSYMDYHGDRFADHSLLVEDSGGAVVALLPACEECGVLSSHSGLTYGGLVTNASMTAPQMMRVFDSVLTCARAADLKWLRYKTVPHIYHDVPAEEDRYALFRHAADLRRRDVLTVVDYRHRLPYQHRRTRALRRAQRAGVEVSLSDDFSAFWPVLEDALMTRHSAEPVHKLEEIQLLAKRFPRNIHLYVAELSQEILAGVVLYETAHVAHLQYIATSEDGRALGGLDALINHLLDEFASRVRYFDFGISNEEEGLVLNEGLVTQKEGFGARTVVHDHYQLDLAVTTQGTPVG